ncbi:MAG TPA: hypothetical protein VH143_25500 [Kofleriaceae bacterium]|nr:hypothetical protein [Kofleriaceae bacterium]
MALRYSLIALLVAACSSSSSPPSAGAPSAAAPPPAAAPAPAPPIVPAPNPEPPPIDAAPPDAAAALAADGAACLAATDCTSGVCEGEGCDTAHPGRCAKASRICAHNRVQICGCDGKTTTASSTCPRMRYAARGACQSSP